MADFDFLNTLGDAMGRVYGACEERLLVNLARHFMFLKPGEKPGGSFQYQARKLQEFGQVTDESARIIKSMMRGADPALMNSLEAAIIEALEDVEPELKRAVQAGQLPVEPQPLAPRLTQAFQTYYAQSADKLNLVNTVMLESTGNAYRATVADVTARMQRTQEILNVATGEVVTGVESFNVAQRLAVQAMVENGITGFVDHAGRQWSPEAYVAMDMRTTFHNTARRAFWDRNGEYGNDLYLVSQHPGARPLCYPWQCKVISRDDRRRWEKDGDGNPVQVWAQSETSYGEPAGLFGINCGHHPELFVPGVSKVPEVRQDEEANAKSYDESQKHRALERDFRRARLDMAVAKAQGDEEGLKQARERIKKADAALDAFTEAHGRKRRREREYQPVQARWPDPETYGDSPTAVRDAMKEFFDNGGAQRGKALTVHGNRGKIDIEVDEMTPCLRKNSTGELVETTIRKISPTRATGKGWEFDWTRPERSGYEVYALRVKGERTIQGMIALKDDPANFGVKIDIVEAAPQNNPHNRLNTSGTKEYNGVGGHLFAEACRRSFEKGYGGFVHFVAKTKLIDHYTAELGAELFNPRTRQMVIQGEAAARLVRIYFGGGNNGSQD